VWAGTAPSAQAPTGSVAVERTDYDMKKIVASPGLSEPELEGRRLVVQRCAYCHDVGRASAPSLDAERLKTVGEAGFREKIMKGTRRMPGWQYALSPAQLDQVMAYIKTVAPEQRPAGAR
jgi:mono/diheme cytochrome c family protein